LVALLGCGGASSDGGTNGLDTSETHAETTTSDDESSTDDGQLPKLDVGPKDVGTPGECKVVDDMDGVGDCEQQAPPDSFEPDIQWSWSGDENEPRHSIATPLVANFTDDNNDGSIDLCDIPDVVVLAYNLVDPGARLFVLDGETGEEHFTNDLRLYHIDTPALGDIDGDGLVEIVALRIVDQLVELVAFEHDGTIKWQKPAAGGGNLGGEALADLDNDGDVEIIHLCAVYDHEGELLWDRPNTNGACVTPTAADLDDDGDLEVVFGPTAYHHDGTVYYMNDGMRYGAPQIGNLDDDPEPEILVSHDEGFSLLEHDGTVVYADLKPTGDWDWRRPAAIHDMDGDPEAEFALSSSSHYTVYEADGSIIWSANISDQSGIAGGTAFDFLGDGIAEAMYADETTNYIFDGSGTPLLQVPRSSGTGREYPVVADVDNDGSAEIVVVSNRTHIPNVPDSPAVQVIRDVDDRWIQARRIWNQHTYHVTNVREDGTIPQYEQPSWELLNTFRTQAQILPGGGVCDPEG
jgi:hypothetical protein